MQPIDVSKIKEPMKVTIPDTSWDAELKEFADLANTMKAGGGPTPNGTYYLVYHQIKVSQEQFELLISKNVLIDCMDLYFVMDSAMLEEVVDSSLPYGDGRLYKDALLEQNLSNDGIQVCAKVGLINSGNAREAKITDAEMRAWLNVFPNVMVLQEYQKLMASDEWKKEDETTR